MPAEEEHLKGALFLSCLWVPTEQWSRAVWRVMPARAPVVGFVIRPFGGVIDPEGVVVSVRSLIAVALQS